MRKLALLLIVGLFSLCVEAQEKVSYKMIEGQVTAIKKSEKAPKAKTADKIVTFIDGQTFYQGAKGGIYYLKVSKTGKEYKCYVKTEKP